MTLLHWTFFAAGLGFFAAAIWALFRSDAHRRPNEAPRFKRIWDHEGLTAAGWRYRALMAWMLVWSFLFVLAWSFTNR